MFFRPVLRVAHPTVSAFARSASSTSNGLSRVLEKRPDDVVLTFAKRTALGRVRKGQLKDIPIDELLHALFTASLKESLLDPALIEDICVGTCHPPSPLYLSRAAALAAGIPHHVPISTVNRLCSSGLMAVRSIAQSIRAGEISLGVAAAVESMSLNPRPTPELSTIVKEHHEAHDCVEAMGWTSEMVAATYNVSREKQDEYALISHTRATEALNKGTFADEIIPVILRGQTLSADDTIRPGVTLESLAALKPAFPQWDPSTTTAGNASGIGDGAGLCILTTRARAEREGMDVIGRYVSSVVVGVEPRVMGISPIVAIPRLLETLSLSKEDVDVYEINEAFASQFAYCVEQLNIPMSKINPNGGSIALTHPVGMTGIRQVVTGLAELHRQGKQLLVTSMCVGSGQGAAGLFVNERLT